MTSLGVSRSEQGGIMKILSILMAAGLLVVISVVLFRSMTHQTRQIQVKPSNADTFDSLSLANRLSKAITFKTIFDQDPAHFKPDEFAMSMGMKK